MADAEGCARATRMDTSGVRAGEVRLMGDFVELQLHERNAVLDKLGWAQRQVAKIVTDQVVIYRQLNEFNYALYPSGEAVVPLKGRGLSEYICPAD